MVRRGGPPPPAADGPAGEDPASASGRLLNYGRGPITKAVSEALNRTIQGIKYTAWGFRRRNGFRRAIYFHCGGLHLDP